jgi:hypothetical protein
VVTLGGGEGVDGCSCGRIDFMDEEDGAGGCDGDRFPISF